MPDAVLSARSRFNATRQHHGDDHPATKAARSALYVEKLARYAEGVAAEIGPLTDDQVRRIADLLAPTAAFAVVDQQDPAA